MKLGGCVNYSTCSLETEENQAIAAGFRERVPGVSLEAERQITPFIDGVDGAYAVCLVRAAEGQVNCGEAASPWHS